MFPSVRVRFPCWVLLPGVTVLTRSGLKHTSLLVITTARMECGSGGRQWEKLPDVLIQRASRRGGGGGEGEQELDCEPSHFHPVWFGCALMWVNGSTGRTACSAFLRPRRRVWLLSFWNIWRWCSSGCFLSETLPPSEVSARSRETPGSCGLLWFLPLLPQSPPRVTSLRKFSFCLWNFTRIVI